MSVTINITQGPWEAIDLHDGGQYTIVPAWDDVVDHNGHRVKRGIATVYSYFSPHDAKAIAAVPEMISALLEVSRTRKSDAWGNAVRQANDALRLAGVLS